MLIFCLAVTARTDGQDRITGHWPQPIAGLRPSLWNSKAPPEYTRANDPFAATPVPAERSNAVATYHAATPSPGDTAAARNSFGLLPPAVGPPAMPGSDPFLSQPTTPTVMPPSATLPGSPAVTPVNEFPLDQDIWGPTTAAPYQAPRSSVNAAPGMGSEPPQTASASSVTPSGSTGPIHPPAPVTTATPSPVAAPAVNTAKSPSADPDDSTRILAVVGDQPILLGDLIGPINLMLAEFEGQAPDWEIAEQRKLLVQRQLPEVIKTKLVMIDVSRTVPADRLASIEDKVRNSFYEERMPDLKEALDAKSIPELDQKLRALGSSLSKQERTFFENVVAREWLRSNIQFEEDVAHEELLTEYRKQQAEYYHPPRVRWERLMVRFDAYPSRSAAMEAIAQLGNRVVKGESFEAVAREKSQCPNAELNGQFDWTRRGSLASKAIEDALFAIPVGRLSRVIEDNEGFHIVRVHERETEGYTPFSEVQVKLAEQVRQRRYQEAVDEYLERLKEEIYIFVAEESDNSSGAPLVSQAATP